MSPTDRIREHLLSSAGQLSDTAERLTGPIVRASECMSETLLQGGRILSFGSGVNSVLAQYLSILLLNRFQRERPGLPAMNLNSDAALMNAIAMDHSFDEVCSRQIRTLGQEGDALIVICGLDGDRGLTETITAARDRALKLIVLDNEVGASSDVLLESNDIGIHAPAVSEAGCREIHLSIIHCLCELIDVQIFGDTL